MHTRTGTGTPTYIRTCSVCGRRNRIEPRVIPGVHHCGTCGAEIPKRWFERSIGEFCSVFFDELTLGQILALAIAALIVAAIASLVIGQ
jgi:hypothetical protein